MGFPDLIPHLRDYLVTDVVSVPVFTFRPDPRPTAFVQLRRVGGTANDPVQDQARVDLFTAAPTDAEAMALALQVRTAVWALPGTTRLSPVVVYRVAEFLGPRMDQDGDTATPTVWATYDITIRANSAIHLPPMEGSP